MGSEVIDKIAKGPRPEPHVVVKPEPNQPQRQTAVADLPKFAEDLVLMLANKDRTEAEERVYAKFLSQYLTRVVRRL